MLSELTLFGQEIIREAVLSDDRVYRYSLSRTWDATLPVALFIGLNPSTADEQKDDPTIRKCIGFAKRWRMGGIVMANLFAFRATLPADMMRAADPVGPLNDAWLARLSAAASHNGGRTVAAWGVGGLYKDRDRQVTRLLTNAECLGTTNGGHPRHPLYVPYSASLVPFGVIGGTNRMEAICCD